MTEERHPAKSMWIVFAIIGLFAVLGGIVGHYSHPYGEWDATSSYAVMGAILGIGAVLFYSLILEFLDL